MSLDLAVSVEPEASGARAGAWVGDSPEDSAPTAQSVTDEVTAPHAPSAEHAEDAAA